MKILKIKTIGIIIPTIVFILLLNVNVIEYDKISRINDPSASPSDAPMDIDTLGDLNSFSDYGNGSYNNPFIIENKIWYGYAYAVDISTQNYYVIIKNCTVYNMGGGINNAGFVLRDCQKITITNCTVYGGTGHGIRSLGYADNNIISECIIYDHQYNGIYLAWSDYNLIINNTIYNHLNSGQGGIYLQDSFYNEVKGNNLSSNYHGITTYYAGGNYFYDNYIFNSTSRGIDLYGSYSSIVDNNTITANIEEGIYLYSHSTAKLFNNTITNNGDYGIHFQSSSMATCSMNNVTNNTGYEIYFGNSDRGKFWLNIFGNTTTPSTQSLVNGFGNDWNYEGFGNYWANFEARYPSAEKIGNFWNESYQVLSSDYDDFPISSSDLSILEPVISNSGNITYEYGSSNNNITWTIYDPSISGVQNYSVYQNNSDFVIDQYWTHAQLFSIGIDGFQVGYYNFTILVHDGNDNQSTDTVYLAVIENQAPNITHPTDFNYSIDTTGNMITWTITDDSINNSYYSIFRNNTEIVTNQTWSSGDDIILDIDGLQVGIYNFTIIAYDGINKSSFDEIFIHVLPNSPPHVNSPIDFYISLNSVGNVIPWVITDSEESSGNYVIYIDGLDVFYGIWTNDSLINHPIDASKSGLFNYSISFTDGNYNGTLDSVFITVSATPTVNSPSDQTVSVGSTGLILPWKILDTDNVSGTYWVTETGISVGTGTWFNDTSIDFYIDISTPGLFLYEIHYSDMISNGTTDIIQVIVNSEPILNSPKDETIKIGAIAEIPWIILDYDNLSGSYEIFKNGLSLSNGAWTNSTSLDFSVDTSIQGVFNYTIVIHDGVNFGVFDTVFFTINVPPTINQPTNRTIGQNVFDELIPWIIEDIDNTTGKFWIYKDGIGVFEGDWINGTSIEFPIDTSVSGLINYTILYTDNISNGTSSSVYITINSNPIVNSPSNQWVDKDEGGIIIPWIITDSDNVSGNYWILRNGVNILGGTWMNTTSIDFSVDTSIPGIINFTILYSDSFSNGTQDIVLIYVEGPPAVNSPDDFTIDVDDVDIVVPWIINDPTNASGTYWVSVDGIGISGGVWINNTALNFPVDTSLRGIFNYTIECSDGISNTTDNVIISINKGPQLSFPTVNPNIGDANTYFNFTVLYTDLDNNAPAYVNVIINGTIYLMSKTNILDTNYVDSCEYMYFTNLSLGNYNYSFECSDSRLINESIIQTDLLVTLINDFVPNLLNPQVTPTIGDNTTIFNFTVTYLDLDNNTPIFVNLLIENSSYSMVKVNIDDDNYVSGVLFYYNTTLDFGYYQFQIECEDYLHSNSTAWINNPKVNPFLNWHTEVTLDNVAVFQDTYPWGYSSIQDILNLNGITYSQFSTSDLGIVSLEGFDKVIIPSVQSASFYTAIMAPSVLIWLENYVYSGGILEFHACTQSGDASVLDLPGGYVSNYQTANTLSINSSFIDHAIVTGITNTEIDGWGSSAHNYITGLKRSDVDLIYDDSYLRSRLMTSRYGAGLFIYSGMTLEWAYGHSYSNILENMILYTEISDSSIDLIAPYNGTVLINDPITFNWTSVEFPFGPITYSLQFSNTSDFSFIIEEVQNIPTTENYTSITYQVGFSDMFVYWRVVPVFEGVKANVSTYFNLTIFDRYSLLSSPDDISYEYGASNNYVIWDFSLFVIDSFQFEVNGVPRGFYAYDNSTSIIARLDGLKVGVNIVMLSVLDFDGYNYTDYIIVNVFDTIAPSVSMEYIIDNDGEKISITCTDGNPNEYTLLMNSTVIISGNWNSSELIYISLGDIDPGLYNFTVIVTDDSGNSAIESIIVEVTGETGGNPNYLALIISVITLGIVAAVLTPLIYLKIKQNRDNANIQPNDTNPTDKLTADTTKTSENKVKPESLEKKEIPIKKITKTTAKKTTKVTHKKTSDNTMKKTSKKTNSGKKSTKTTAKKTTKVTHKKTSDNTMKKTSKKTSSKKIATKKTSKKTVNTK